MGARDLISTRTGILLFASLALHFVSMRLADRIRRKPALRVWDPFVMFLPVLAAAGIVTLFQHGTPLLFMLLFIASIVNIALRARSLITPKHSLERVRLGAARDFLEEEAASGRAIPEQWVPYFFAFGLKPRVTIEPKAFWACGGVERFSELADKLLAPFSVRTTE